MKYKGTLILVKDIESSRKYYNELFGLNVILDNDGNMLLDGGIYLQEKKYWNNFIKRDVISRNNASELYFEENDIDEFVKRLEALYPDTEYVNKLMTHTWGQKVVRFYDLDGNLIEVGTPMPD